MTALTLGSLFDGSGGFPLAALHVGIRPVWASEVEPFPILVTSTRLPEVTHLGDVNTIDGTVIEPVDIVSFGSPCQDLSVAGRQTGLAGSRSGLFFQAVRIIKEMREATNDQYPRFAVWENVPGAFSSNQGADFAAVLTSLIQVVAPSVPDGLFLTRGGPTLGPSWQADARLHGVYSMRNISASPNDAAASTLSQILQADPHPRFFLSPRACQGILNRAARKNKTMPTPLKQALEAVAAR